MNAIARPKRRYKREAEADDAFALPAVPAPVTGEGFRGYRLKRSGQPHSIFRGAEPTVDEDARLNLGIASMLEAALVRLQELHPLRQSR